jgi:hypothetical protein
MRHAFVTFGLITALTGVPGAPAARGSETILSPGGVGKVVEFDGYAHINCFGCGTSTGTASMGTVCVSGNANGDDVAACGYTRLGSGRRILNGSATAIYTVQEDPGASCVITGSADGTGDGTGTAFGRMMGSLNAAFHWTRVGANAILTTTGDVTGAGTAEFAVTSPALPSIPCGGSVDAEFVGSVAGT